MKYRANPKGPLTARMRVFMIWETVKGTSLWASSWDCTRKRIPREILVQRRQQESQTSWASGLTRPRRLTKLRTTFLSLLANQWMIFPSPQSDRHKIVSDVDVHGVEANAQTQLSHLHELLYCLFFVLFIHFIFMRKHHSPFRFLFFFSVNELSRLWRHLMIIMLCICFLIFYTWQSTIAE